MKQSKKGITLVELIICCAIIVMVGGACTAILMSGHTIFNNSAKSANAQLNTDVVQTYLSNMIPRATNIGQLADADEAKPTTGGCIYFQDDTFIVRVDGKDTSIPNVSGFTYSLISAGKSGFARAQFVYTVTMTDGSSYTSGFVMGNLKYDSVIVQTNIYPDAESKISDVDLKTNPICFSVAVGS